MTDEYWEAITDWVTFTTNSALEQVRAAIVKNYQGDDDALEAALEAFYIATAEF